MRCRVFPTKQPVDNRDVSFIAAPSATPIWRIRKKKQNFPDLLYVRGLVPIPWIKDNRIGNIVRHAC